MRILVTGATGLVGNNCVRLLLEQQHDVHVLVRPGYAHRPLDGLDVKVHLADLHQPPSIREVLPPVEAIIHAAADTHIGRQPRPAQVRINVDSTSTLAAAAQELGAKFVFVSSVDALPPGRSEAPANEETPDSPKYPCGYVNTKRAAEAALITCMEAGLSAVIVNPGFMLGPWDWKPSSGRMLLRIANSFAPFSPKGGFSVCDVRDVAAAIVRAATTPTRHERYILAGHNMRYLQAWRMFARLTGGRGPLCPAGPLMRMVAGKWGDAWAKLAGSEGDVNSAAIGMSDLYHYYDSTRAVEVLDYRIRPAEESVNAAWSWFQQYGYTR